MSVDQGCSGRCDRPGARVAYRIDDLLNRVDDQVRLVAGDEVPALLGDDETAIRDQRGQFLLQRQPDRLQCGGGVVRRPVPGEAVGEDDQGHRAQGGGRGRLPHLGGAGVGVEPLAVRVIGELRRPLLLEARDLRPLLRRQHLPHRRVVVLVRGVDEDQPHHLIRVGGGIEAGDQAAEGMTGQHVGTGNRGRGQQRVQVSDDRRPRRAAWARDRCGCGARGRGSFRGGRRHRPG